MSAKRQLANSVCTQCGVTCDDIVLRATGNELLGAENACTIGRNFFVGYKSAEQPATIGGDEISLDEAYELAARWLAEAASPAIFGIASGSTESQRAAVALADRTGCIIDWTTSDADAAAIVSLQTVGSVTATWGEVAQRADTVVYWASDPTTTHPRMVERYTETPTSRWLPDGRADRHVVIVDEFISATKADLSIRVATGSHYAALSVLRALTKKIALDTNEVKAATGVELADWQALHTRMLATKFGAVVYGKRLASEGPATLSALTQLMADLTAKTRWVAVSEGGYGNATGAANVMSSQAGSPMAVDFSQRVPRYRPLEANMDLAMRRGEHDVVMFCGPSPSGSEIRLHQLSDELEIVIPVATPGVDATGTTYRSDGVALPLRAILETSRPLAEVALKQIERRESGNGSTIAPL